MAFNDLIPSDGPFFLAPGQSMGITVWFGDPGDDHGAQWIMAHPIAADTQPPAQLTVTNFTKELHYELGSVTQNGAATYHYYDPYYRYSVTVTNTGSSAVFFSVQGGGNS
ncbi:MAG TPA: hypothetical protein VHW69_16980 [Rhizomicrobium sp.]|jgi:hypothetical protein|nr:hypothetical protein [Rhizomicrobium sp.]